MYEVKYIQWVARCAEYCMIHRDVRDGCAGFVYRYGVVYEISKFCTLCTVCCTPAKLSTEVTKCTSSNILVWFGRDAPEKSVVGLRESLISSPFAKFAKGLEKYRK
jgi:hypothetical protein